MNALETLFDQLMADSYHRTASFQGEDCDHLSARDERCWGKVLPLVLPRELGPTLYFRCHGHEHDHYVSEPSPLECRTA